MCIDICIPAYNEEPIIAESVRSVSAALALIQNVEWRVLVAENGSFDKTAEYARLAGAHVLSLSERGKGAAIIAAGRSSSADIFGFIDADLSADPAYIAVLLEEIQNGADIAIGSRLLDRRNVKRSVFRTGTSLIFNILRRSLIGVKVSDTQCGLKLMTTQGLSLLTQCKETGWFLDMEFLARAELSSLKIKEVPVLWNEHHFEDRVSKLDVFRDGIEAIRAMFRIRKTIQWKK